MNNIIDSYKHIPYTFRHIIAFCQCEERLTGKLRVKSIFHDVDKIIMYLFVPFLGTKKINKIHRKYSSHHTENGEDILSMIIDWECTRVTKTDKPLNAAQTLHKYYPELEQKILPKLIELGLI